MFHLMKSEKLTIDHALSGSMSSYRQIPVEHFRQFGAALSACEVANDKVGFPRHYVLNESGEEYYEGTWIA